MIAARCLHARSYACSEEAAQRDLSSTDMAVGCVVMWCGAGWGGEGECVGLGGGGGGAAVAASASSMPVYMPAPLGLQRPQLQQVQENPCGKLGGVE